MTDPKKLGGRRLQLAAASVEIPLPIHDQDSRANTTARGTRLGSSEPDGGGTEQPSVPMMQSKATLASPVTANAGSPSSATRRRRYVVPSSSDDASSDTCTSSSFDAPGPHRVPGMTGEELDDDTIQVGGVSVDAEMEPVEAELVDERLLADQLNEAVEDRIHEAQERAVNEILQNAVYAGVVRRKSRPLCFAGVAFLAISAGLAISLWLSLTDPPAPDASPEPTASPTIPPPSQAPSQLPTMSPTGFHDDCEFARGPLKIAPWGMSFENDDIVIGNTTNATNSEIPTCGDISPSDSPGVWFYVVGNGKPLTATTCTNIFEIDGDYDSQMTVMTGSCRNLTCAGGNDDDDTDQCGSEAGVTWQSIEDEIYYIYVQAYSDFETGTFGLGVQEFLNDRCQIATGMTNLGEVYTGSTVDATGDVVGECDAASASNAPGVWFTIVGTGKELVAETCVGIPELEGNFFKQITILEGVCGNLECVAGGLQGSCGSETAVAWQSTLGTRYYILVHGFRAQVGVFGLRVREVQE